MTSWASSVFGGILPELDTVARDAIDTRVMKESSELDADGMSNFRDLDEIPFRNLAHDACMPLVQHDLSNNFPLFRHAVICFLVCILRLYSSSPNYCVR